MENDPNRSSSTEHTNIHSLIMKIWIRNGDVPGAQATWHGRITHVPSGEHVYANDPDELLTNVAAHFRKLGVRLATCWRIRLWLHELMHRSQREKS